MDGSAGYVTTCLGDFGVLGGSYRTTSGASRGSSGDRLRGFTVLQGTLLSHYSPIAGLALTAELISIGEQDVGARTTLRRFADQPKSPRWGGWIGERCGWTFTRPDSASEQRQSFWADLSVVIQRRATGFVRQI
ncbi:MAG: hypothetical protein H6685_09590 [Deltaproteobacteria bacterium]|nr:hypothetical protein [Deltaproteobacteria bacterium]